jgi:AcrR family transcriptional regulator
MVTGSSPVGHPTFVARGFHQASIDDLVAESGVSVGAVYNYCGGKDELIHESILAAVNAEAEAVFADTRSAGSVRDKMEQAIRGWFDYTIDAPGAASPPGAAAFLVQCWAVASQKPLIRDLLVRRRERMAMLGVLIGREGVATGELPGDFDVDAMARGFTALLDGLVLQRVEDGDSYRRPEMERRALAWTSSPRVGLRGHRSRAPSRAPSRQGRGRRSAKRGAHSPIPTPNAVWPRNMIRLSRAPSPERRPNQP